MYTLELWRSNRVVHFDLETVSLAGAQAQMR